MLERSPSVSRSYHLEIAMLKELFNASEVVKSLTAVAAVIERSGLDYGLLSLAWLSAPQINSCVFCLHNNVKDALKRGEIMISSGGDKIEGTIRYPSVDVEVVLRRAA